MADNTHMTKEVSNLFDELFSEDYESLKNVDQVFIDYQKQETSLKTAIEESEVKTEGDLNNLSETCTSTLQELESISEQITSLLTQYQTHIDTVTKPKDELESKVIQNEQLEQEICYKLWVDKIQSQSSAVKKSINSSDIKNAVDQHYILYQICAALQSSACGNLRNFSYDVCEKLYQELRASIESKLSVLLTTMKFPFANGVSAPVFNQKEETEEQFKNLLTIAVKLQSLSIDSKYSLVTLLLTDPFKKRFHFHFYGDRHTNNVEKPEWFLTQILNWKRDHMQFIEGYINPLLKECTKDEEFSLKDEFLEILLDLCEEKLRKTLKQCLDDDVLLAHLIDETMVFDKELQLLTPGQPEMNCIKVLLEEENLKHWIDLEKKLAMEVITDLIEKPNNWQPKFSDVVVIEKKLSFYVPKCVEEFVTMVSMMMNRYENISERSSQKLFMVVLNDTINSFVLEMKQKASVEHIRPESQAYCSIMNGAFYLHHILTEWSSDIRFLSILIDGDTKDSNESDNEAEEEEDIARPFDTEIQTLEKFLDELIDWLIKYMTDGLKNKLKPYKAESWHSLPRIKDYVIPTLSSGACSLMLFIKEHLHSLEEKCYHDVFDKIWREFCYSIDELLFTEIVCECHFNEGGASQLQFDIKKNLYVLFGQYTLRVENYFKRLRESCILLNLLAGSALLIKERLKVSTAENSDEIQDILEEHDIHVLSFEHVNRIIHSRVDWPKV
ncbi:RAD50-interacting protein 1-like [Clytia hemisphaerica]|uniref:RAD50-interacting protein 1-like n=1 Tax=Clytia hemisphaerica TaxID=252671 RepID=UPI0034D46D2B